MAQIAQFPGLGMYDKGGKFEVKQEFIDAARAKAIEEGKKYYGDATNFEVFKDSVLNLPDAAINFVARGVEGTGELAAGIASLAFKGAQLATTTDPDKLTQIMSEPSFTKYMGAYKGKLGKPNLFTSDISGIEENVDRVGDVAYLASPVPVLPAAKGIPFLFKAGKAAKEGTENIAKDVVKSFTQGDSGFRASAGGPGKYKGGQRGIPKDPKTISFDFVLNSNAKQKNKVFKILEDVRTGKISEAQASQNIENIFPNKGGLYQASQNKTRKKFVELRDDYNQYRRESPKFEEDIYDIKVDSPNNPTAITRTEAQKVIKLADKDSSLEPYSVKYANAYAKITGKNSKNLMSDNDYIQSKKTAMAIMNFNNRAGDELLKVPSNGQVEILNDGTRTFISRGDRTAKKSFQVDYNVGDWIKGKAVNHLRNIADSTGKPFSMVSREISKQDPYVAEKILEMRTFFDEDLGRAHFYGLDHVQAPRFGGTNSMDNLRFTMEGPHNSLKPLTPDKTLSDIAIKNKSRMEDDVHKLAIKLVDNIAAGKNDEAIKISEQIKKITNDFANTYKKTDFQIGEPYVPIKTGDNTAEFVKYSDYLKLDSKSKNRISELLPDQFNKPNAGKSIEEQVDEVYTIYAEMFNLGGPIKKSDMTQLMSMGKKDGGIVGIDHLTRPL